MILIVGAGPIGIELAIELTRLKVAFRIVEAGSTGSTIEWYAPGTEIFSSPERIAVAGIPFEPLTRKAYREDYLLYLRNVVRQFRLPIEHYKRVVRVEKTPAKTFLVTVARSSHGVGGPLERYEHDEETGQSAYAEVHPETETIAAEHVILAIGNLHVPQYSKVPGENLTHVSHYLGEPHRYAGTRVTIIGSGNSAAEAAIRLHHVGALVTMCHRKEGFRPKRVKAWLAPELSNLTKEGKIQVHVNFELKEITRSSVIGAVREQVAVDASEPSELVEPSEPGEHIDPTAPIQPLSIDSDFVLLLTGYRQKTDLFEQIGVSVVNDRPVVDIETMETNVPNVFIIGTAAVGTEVGGVTTFIENAHVHVKRVLHALNLKDHVPPSPDRPVEEREI